MSDSVELDAFDISVLDPGPSLSVWPHLHIAVEAASQLSCQALHARVQAGQLWFLPPRIFHLQIIVQFKDRSLSDLGPSRVLEFLEGSIRLSTVSQCLHIAHSH
jgi:hypothetical protein